jgi:hypothetical protein
VFVLCLSGFLFLVGWGVYHSCKRDIREIVMRQVRGTQFEHRGYTWALCRCGKPIERILAAGEIQSGDRIADVMSRHAPARTESYARYTYLLYFPPLSLGGGPVIVAKDGVVVQPRRVTVVSPICSSTLYPRRNTKNSTT